MLKDGKWKQVPFSGSRLAFVFALAAGCASAQVPGTPATNPSAAIPAAEQAAPQQPVSMLEQPPKQAVVEERKDNLSVRADNASLTQTLQRIADLTGMQLEGISGDQRVFGNFGPGAPKDVLTTLLNGTGYNVAMVGNLDNGAPRELILSTKQSLAASPAPAQPQQPPADASDDDSPDATADDQPPPNAPPHGGMNPSGVRSPQDLLQQMQQMRNQQVPTPQQ